MTIGAMTGDRCVGGSEREREKGRRWPDRAVVGPSRVVGMAAAADASAADQNTHEWTEAIKKAALAIVYRHTQTHSNR